MMAGILIASIVAGRLISRTGRIKPFIVGGAISLTVGFAGLGLVDHRTPIVAMSAAMLLVGVGVGTTMQNFVLVVQNAVPLKDVGAASSTVAFFRSLGGTIGVSVLGAVLARQVAARINQDLAAAGGQNVGALPTQAQEIVRAAYGDATGHIFLISAVVALLGVVAAALLKSVTLRTSLDLSAAKAATVAADAADGAPALDQVNTETPQAKANVETAPNEAATRS
jgi:MFS family permease